MSFGGNGSGPGSISGSSDVALSNPADNQVLGYNAALDKWQNQTSSTSDATASSKGVVQLTGDLGGTATSPTVQTIQGKTPVTTDQMTSTNITDSTALGRSLLTASSTTAAQTAVGGIVPSYTVSSAHVAAALGWTVLPGPAGGSTDDAAILTAAIAAGPNHGTYWFQPGTYNLATTLVLKNGCTYEGQHSGATGYGTVLQRASGAALTGNAVVCDAAYAGSGSSPTSASAVTLRGIAIDCQQSVDNDTASYGLVLMTYRSLVDRCTVYNPGACGMAYVDRNQAGNVITNSAVENRWHRCAVYSGTANLYCYLVTNYSSGAITDGYMTDCIAAGSYSHAVFIQNAAGWFITNNHAYGCHGDAFTLYSWWDTFFAHNEVDHFGRASGTVNSSTGTYYGVNVDRILSGRPGVMSGNIVSTDEAANPNCTFVYYRVRNSVTGLATKIIFRDNTAHQDSVGNNSSSGLVVVPNTGTIKVVGMQHNIYDGSIVPPSNNQTLASAGAVTIDANLGDASITLNANATGMTINNPTTWQDLRIELIQDSTGGRTYTWATNCRFAGGSAPNSTAANTSSAVTFRYNGSLWVETGRAVAVPVI